MSQATWMQWALEPAALLRGDGVTQRSNARRLRAEPHLALAATCAIHVLLLYGLGRIPVSPTARADRADGAIEVIWIERPETAPADAMRIPPDARVDRRPSTRPQRGRSGAAPVVSTPSPRVATADPASAPATRTQAVADDAWQPMPGARRSSASDIDPSAFRRDPLARRDEGFEPKPAALEHAIQDRSFGGWMQAATRRRMCGDLRAALRRSPENTESIIDSMRKRGCRV